MESGKFQWLVDDNILNDELKERIQYDVRKGVVHVPCFCNEFKVSAKFSNPFNTLIEGMVSCLCNNVNIEFVFHTDEKKIHYNTRTK